MAGITGIGNAPCSWGVLEFDLDGQAPEHVRVLDEMAQAGYAGTELGDWGFMPTEPEALREVLSMRNLAMLGAFVPVPLSDPEAIHAGRRQALETARLLASVGGDRPVIVLSDDNGSDVARTRNAGRIPYGTFQLTPAQWERAAYTANHIALAVREETGLRTVFHPHCAGYVETPEEVGRFLEMTHPHMLGLCLDTAHCAYGGGDPLECVRRYGDRIWHVHFKGYHADVAAQCRKQELDYFDAVRQGVFCELGQSTVNFKAVLSALAGADYEGWVVVEQDVLPGQGNPLESAVKNREYLRVLGL